MKQIWNRVESDEDSFFNFNFLKLSNYGNTFIRDLENTE